jgi:hypothetical protein
MAPTGSLAFTANPNIPINMAHLNRPIRSAGGQSVENSDGTSDGELTTALPRFDKEKEKKDRGIRGVLPFKSKRKDKGDKQKEKDKGRDRSGDRAGSKDRDRGGAASAASTGDF